MTNGEARAAGAAAYRAGAARACTLPYPRSFPGFAESRMYAEFCAEWYRGWDVANITATMTEIES